LVPLAVSSPALGRDEKGEADMLPPPRAVGPAPQPASILPPHAGALPEHGFAQGPHAGPGPAHGHGPDAPREFAKRALSAYIIEPPDILLVRGTRAISELQRIDGPHLVRPDGTIGLGVYGAVFVAGRTVEEARDAIAAALQRAQPKLKVDKIRQELE